MASNYQGFVVTTETTAGVIEAVGAGVDVNVREEGEVADVAESPLTTDSNGEIASGSLAAVSVGTKVHFRIEEYDGMAGSIAQITT